MSVRIQKLEMHETIDIWGRWSSLCCGWVSSFFIIGNVFLHFIFALLHTRLGSLSLGRQGHSCPGAKVLLLCAVSCAVRKLAGRSITLKCESRKTDQIIFFDIGCQWELQVCQHPSYRMLGNRAICGLCWFSVLLVKEFASEVLPFNVNLECMNLLLM